MNSIKQLAGQTVVYGASSIVGRLLNYLLVPLHVYIFTNPSEYGIVGEMYAWVSLLIVLLVYGMETAFFRYNESRDEKNLVFGSAFISLFITTALFLVAVFLFIDPISQILQYPNNQEYIIWFSFIIALDVLSTIPFARLRAQNRAGRFVFVKLAGIFTNIILNLFFLLLAPWLYSQESLSVLVSWFYSPTMGIGYIFIANLFSSAITLLLLISVIKIRDLKFNFALWKEMFVYAFPLLIFGLAGIVNETMDRILIKHLSTPAESMANVGIYSACYKISILITIFIQAFRYAAEPFFFSKAKEKDAKETYATVMSYFVVTCSIIFLSIMMYIDIVQYFVSEPYRVGLGIVPILLLANVFLGIFYNLSVWYKVTGQTKFGAYISILGVVITLAMNFILIPLVGYVGAAWTTLVCYFVMSVASYVLGQKHYHVNYNLQKIFGYLFLALFLYLVSLTYQNIALSLKLALNSVVLIGYLTIIYFVERKSLKLIFLNDNSKNEYENEQD